MFLIPNSEFLIPNSDSNSPRYNLTQAQLLREKRDGELKDEGRANQNDDSGGREIRFEFAVSGRGVSWFSLINRQFMTSV